MNIRLFREEDKEEWDRYVRESNSAACYHLIGWKDVIEKSFGHKAYYLLSEDEEKRINGILPIIRMKSVIFGTFMVSLPFFNYGGISSDTPEIRERLLYQVIEIAKKENAGHVELRQDDEVDKKLPAKTAKVSMRLTLPRSGQDLWDSFPAKLRSQIRRPTKEGMHSVVGREEELDGFYSVFSRNMRDLGTPVYAKSFFRNILERFPETTHICTVYTQNGQAAASGFLVGFKGTLEIPWASSLRSYNQCGPNMLLYWSVLQHACEKGFKVFDFGRSTRDEGTYRFKEQWGARPVQLYWYYWMRNEGALPELNPRNPKYQMAIKVWKKLPIAVTKLIGPSIVKNLP